MVEYALANGRYLGMIRPRHSEDPNPPLYSIGCGGKITSFEETEDGRFLIELHGVSRFELKNDFLADRNFRVGEVDWSAFENDRHLLDDNSELPRDDLLSRLSQYLDCVGLSADWDTIEQASVNSIVSSVSMNCPFEADEKQALLEATDLLERVRSLMALMDMAIAENTDGERSETKIRMQ